MFRRSTTQTSFFDPWFGLTDAKRARLDRTWAPVFRERIVPLIDETAFAHFYCPDNGRPNAPIRLVVGVLLLKEWFDLTDAEALGALEYDMRWHVALAVDPASAHLCQKTLHTFRAVLYGDEAARLLFGHLTDALTAALGVTTHAQRLDSTHIQSNFARLTRLGVFCETQRVLLRALTREAVALLETIPSSLRRRYLDEDGTDSSYDDARASDSRRRLGVAARDAYRLREALRGVALPAAAAAAYALVVRLVEEHCELVAAPQACAEGDADADLAPVPVVAKEAKALTGDVLQTPHDPGVTYSGHKGQGYDVLVAETCAPDNPVQLITHVSLERACESDADRVEPTVEALAAREMTPDRLLADTSFGSVENVAACARQGVELIAPQPGTAGDTESPPTLCVRDEEFTVQLTPAQPPSTCPCGVAALQTVLRDDPEEGPVALVQMPASACAACPRRGWCPALTLADGDRLVLIALRENLPARRRAVEETAAFLDAYRPRAGIEGTNSELKRGQGLRKLRVRGEERVRLSVYFKALACNVKRAVNYWVAQRKQGVFANSGAQKGTSIGQTALIGDRVLPRWPLWAPMPGL